jgi:hypothetical protein
MNQHRRPYPNAHLPGLRPRRARLVVVRGSGGGQCDTGRGTVQQDTAKRVLVSPIPPYLIQTPDNPDGLP